MRILVHDYSGHPFQVQLSQELATRGHVVTHLYCASNPATPQAGLRGQNRALGLRIVPINMPRDVSNEVFLERWWLTKIYGRRLASRIGAIRPDVVLLANTPLDAAADVCRACRTRGVPVVYWLQDLLGEAAVRILASRLGPAGRLIGQYYQAKERTLLRRSAHIIGITEDFRARIARSGVSSERYTTIPNWAPLQEIIPRPKENVWSREHGLDGSFVFLYSGNLGMKHNPALLLALAHEFAQQSKVRVVVNSQGAAADWLRAQAVERHLSHLQVNPFQPYPVVSDVLGAADVLVALLEPEAGIFSVPSKVLAYHCAARPLLLAVPCENLAATIVGNEGTGVVVDPRDEKAFVAAASRLYGDRSMRCTMAARARAYAERNFQIGPIADRFESILAGVAQR